MLRALENTGKTYCCMQQRLLWYHFAHGFLVQHVAKAKNAHREVYMGLAVIPLAVACFSHGMQKNSMQ
jgi:hypothetical protein